MRRITTFEEARETAKKEAFKWLEGKIGSFTTCAELAPASGALKAWTVNDMEDCRVNDLNDRFEVVTPDETRNFWAEETKLTLREAGDLIKEAKEQWSICCEILRGLKENRSEFARELQTDIEAKKTEAGRVLDLFGLL